MGICAGAYYLCGKVHFKGKTQEMPIIEERELKFYPGTAYGPLLPYDNTSWSGAAVYNIECNIGKFPAYYKGGCFFETHRRNFHI